jgi:hypothetical protein
LYVFRSLGLTQADLTPPRVPEIDDFDWLLPAARVARVACFGRVVEPIHPSIPFENLQEQADPRSDYRTEQMYYRRWFRRFVADNSDQAVPLPESEEDRGQGLVNPIVVVATYHSLPKHSP